ncbi:hypothetical protein [Legionella hackeliae]|nr:hypothetical protein [Legionella hackeliae]
MFEKTEGHSASSQTVNHPPSTGSSSLLLQSYKKYKLLDEYTDASTIRIEDTLYQHVPVTNDPTTLKDGTNYLYIITESGETWFAPQFSGGQKLTHGGLIRKALGIEKGTPTPPVLSSGAIVKYDHEFFLNLASGHFVPDVPAYIPTVEILFDKLGKNYSLGVQVGYAHTHYKSLRVDSCAQSSFELTKNLKDFKLALLDYLHSDFNSETQAVAAKIFDSINVAGEVFDEENLPTFSEKELELLVQDEKLSTLVQHYKSYCPEAIAQRLPEDPNPKSSFSMT